MRKSDSRIVALIWESCICTGAQITCRSLWVACGPTHLHQELPPPPVLWEGSFWARVQGLVSVTSVWLPHTHCSPLLPLPRPENPESSHICHHHHPYPPGTAHDEKDRAWDGWESCGPDPRLILTLTKALGFLKKKSPALATQQ